MCDYRGMKLEPVQKISKIIKTDFKREFLEPAVPVVMKEEASHWPAMGKWNKEFFQQKYGDNLIRVVDDFGKPGKNYMSSVKEMRLGDYLEILSQGKTHLRLFLYNIVKACPELKDDVVLPTFLKGFSKRFMFMFFGAEGSVTQLHYDIDNSHVFHTNFSGKKRWYLFPKEEGKFLYAHPFTVRSYVDPVNPDFEKFPMLKKAKGYYVELEPGETLFIPAGYWHHVVYDSPSYALSLRCPHHKISMRMMGILNILFVQMVDRLVNKLNPEGWFKWKEKKADLIARRT